MPSPPHGLVLSYVSPDNNNPQWLRFSVAVGWSLIILVIAVDRIYCDLNQLTALSDSFQSALVEHYIE
jgi:hypothetical protein